jgi:hypothetical protein
MGQAGTLKCGHLPVSVRSDFTEGIQHYMWYSLIDCKSEF